MSTQHTKFSNFLTCKREWAMGPFVLFYLSTSKPQSESEVLIYVKVCRYCRYRLSVVTTPLISTKQQCCQHNDRLYYTSCVRKFTELREQPWLMLLSYELAARAWRLITQSKPESSESHVWLNKCSLLRGDQDMVSQVSLLAGLLYFF